MTILFLSQIVPYPPHGGVLQRGYNLVRQLGRRARVHLLAFVHPDVLKTDAAVEESRAVLSEMCETVEYFPLWPKRSRGHRLAALAAGACSSQPFSVIAHRSATFGRRVTDTLAARRFDLLHVDTLALAPFVERHRAIPSVLTHHNVESMLMARRAEVERGALARRFLAREAAKLQAYESLVSPTFDVNIFMSPQDEAALASRVPGLCGAVVPNGVDVEYFAPDATPETPALIYTGGMNMFANRDAVMHFLEAIWPAIVAARPDVRFYAVGQDPPKDLLALAARDPRIVVTGYVDDIRPFVRQAAVYVVPLRVGGGTRLKVLDAMASGKAIVSTAIGCEGLDVTPDEHLVVADRPDAFAQATLRLLADHERRRAFGAAARARVERRYAWSVVGTELLDAYALAIERRARSSSAPVAAAG